jgi:meso-butanediol dehydrogenase / (S,S)-butanediol dehydrogenase / diacetyl reductase
MESRHTARFAGRRALVTGAGSGIGAAVARGLHAEGADVVLADLRSEPAEAIAGELGERAAAAALDVRDEGAVREVARDVDVLVNSAGIGSTTTAPETPLAVWEDVFAVNARGTFLCCKHAIPGMIERGGGSIVNVASVGGVVALRNRAAYCASKGAVAALTRAIAIDHVAEGIRCNAVAPGTIDTPYFDEILRKSPVAADSRKALEARQLLGRLGTPEEIAAGILFLASDESRFATGTILTIDGGMTAQ